MAARRLRVARIRRIVVVAAVSVFIALFATVYIQMAAGHDPVLAAHATAPSQSTSQVPEPAPVTTQQS